MGLPDAYAFLEEALIGHEELFNELERCQKEKSLSNHFPEYDVLETDHRDAINSIIEVHGESVAGHLFQDFFAHLLGLVGYQTIRINPVGIPDVDVSDLLNSTGEYR